MARKRYLIFLVVAVVVAVFFYFGRANEKNEFAWRVPEGPQVCFGANCYAVELARTAAQREQGLMGRSSLAQDWGMLFIFPEDGIYPFWMKNTLIPLDIIWLDAAGKIVSIKRDAPPCDKDPCPLFDPQIASRYVLELAAGETQKLNLRIGNSATFNLGKF